MGDIVDMKDPLPVPDQLEKQLAKCKTVRDADTFFKSRDKTKQVRDDTMCRQCRRYYRRTAYCMSICPSSCALLADKLSPLLCTPLAICSAGDRGGQGEAAGAAGAEEGVEAEGG